MLLSIVNCLKIIDVCVWMVFIKWTNRHNYVIPVNIVAKHAHHRLLVIHVMGKNIARWMEIHVFVLMVTMMMETKNVRRAIIDA
jgi:hypothetical protein